MALRFLSLSIEELPVCLNFAFKTFRPCWPSVVWPLFRFGFVFRFGFAVAIVLLPGLPGFPFVGFHPDFLFPSGDAPQMTADPLLTHSRTSPGHLAALV